MIGTSYGVEEDEERGFNMPLRHSAEHPKEPFADKEKVFDSNKIGFRAIWQLTSLHRTNKVRSATFY